MSLATVIRLEFAYPGVGVLAGDSLQYLSIATAHGVIMVFFMIMPTIFGAFGNFLLPTQLGVHDVAFPRLNSAAFWFLPGGLLMLCQLVCTDRRYQRMNCFNIRELQGILKRRFFTDLINSSDYREVLDSSMIGLRYKTNNEFNLNHDSFSFYSLGTTTTSKFRSAELYNNYSSATNTNAILVDFFVSNNFNIKHCLHSLLSYFYSLLSELITLALSLSVYSLLSTLSLKNLSYFFGAVLTNFNISYKQYSPYNLGAKTNEIQSTNYVSSNSTDTTTSLLYTNLERSDDVRYNKFSNPVISYDYKCGHYLGI